MVTIDNVTTAVENARKVLIEYITTTLDKLGGECSLHHQLLAYVDTDGDLHQTYADGIFRKGDFILVGVDWFDEEGELDRGNQNINALSVNELNDIAMILFAEDAQITVNNLQ